MPSSAKAAATSSCVESGLDPQRATFAPPATNVSTNTAVSLVTWRQAPKVKPLNGFSLANLVLIWHKTGMCAAAHSIFSLPCGANDLSLTWNCSIGHSFVFKGRARIN